MGPSPDDVRRARRGQRKCNAHDEAERGGVGIATGAVAGVLAIGKHSTLAGECPADCKQSDIDSYHAIGAISTAGFIAGGVLAGAGLVLILTAPPRTSSPGA